MLISDIKKIGDRVHSGRISIFKERYSDWILHAYFARYEHLSLDNKEELEYFLTTAGTNAPPNYERLNLKLETLQLYQKK